MAREKKQVEESVPAGAPDWMVTFSDCMTLLLTFFVLLLSYSSFDDVIIQQLKGGFTKELPSITTDEDRSKDAFLPYKKVRYIEELEKGSEKLTFDKTKEGTMEEDSVTNFHNKKIFLWSSSQIFWGNGIRISPEGQDTLKTMASFLKQVAGRIVISENKLQGGQRSEQLGLSRSWEVMEYLKKEGLDENRFSLSAGTTITRKNRQTEQMGLAGANSGSNNEAFDRKIEIVLLERSVFN